MVSKSVFHPSSQSSINAALEGLLILNSPSRLRQVFSPSEVKKSVHLDIMLPYKWCIKTPMLLEVSSGLKLSCSSLSLAIVSSPRDL